MKITLIEIITEYSIGIKLISINHGQLNRSLLGLQLSKFGIKINILFFNIIIH